MHADAWNAAGAIELLAGLDLAGEARSGWSYETR
jgi:hypothetical protein